MNELDKKLKNWASSHEASPDHLLKVKETIRRNVVRRSLSEGGRGILAWPAKRSREAWATLSFWTFPRVAAMAAAALLFLWVGMQLGRSSPTPVARPDAADDVLAAISSQQAEGDRVLFSEMNRLFAGQLRYVTRSGGNVDMTLESKPESSAIIGTPTLVRVTIVKRRDGGKWEPCWGVDVLARGEEFVDIAPEQGGGRLRIWAYPMDDGKVAVDLDMNINAPVQLSSTKSLVMDQGRPVQLISQSKDGVEYRVFQTVKAL